MLTSISVSPTALVISPLAILAPDLVGSWRKVIFKVPSPAALESLSKYTNSMSEVELATLQIIEAVKEFQA